jgi:hypothetical protein
VGRGGEQLRRLGASCQGLGILALINLHAGSAAPSSSQLHARLTARFNELLLLGDPILLAPADDLADYDAAPAGAAAGAPRASSSQEALEGNALLQAGLAEELAASRRGLLASGFQDAAQRCSRAFRWALEEHVPFCMPACMRCLPACLPACLVCPAV